MTVQSRIMKYFMAVARCGSIRRASEQLGIAASAVDRQILHAEAELGVPLFERHPSGLQMTAAGELLFTTGQKWERDWTETQAGFNDLQGLKRGHITIAIVDALTRGGIPKLIGQFRKSYPGIVIASRVMDNHAIAGAVTEREAEFGLLLDPPARRDLIVQSYTTSPLGIVCPPDHPLAARSEVRLGQCHDYPFIMPAPPLALRRRLDPLLSASLTKIAPVTETDSIRMIRSLIGAGVGISILLGVDVLSEVEAGSLRFVPLAEARSSPAMLALAVSRTRILTSGARLLAAEIERFLAGSHAALTVP
ncbi:LysR family transcriptional regulator [Acetobacter sp. LMG 1636]|uniref:LysR family transcriptional regulator n=2 Tax=Acetobacter fallax TaxID=1737473 RepID=A0ABX0K510_9PROT|nr:LysR family transcriptional regulator [Acetobacter fallax]NHO34952.1 LysR family transcriptional regulator [Acetobacter fallax]